MKIQNLQLLLVIVLSSLIMNSCSKEEEITYDVYFWAASEGGAQEDVTLFIDGTDHGVLVRIRGDLSCSEDAVLLESLTSLQLSNGKHKIETKNDSDELKSSGTLNIKSNSQALISGKGGFEVNTSNDCTLIKISQ